MPQLLYRMINKLHRLAWIGIFCASLLHAQPNLANTASSHENGVRFVTVEENVSLEVIDWGGTGKPLVFLSGQGGTASNFAAFATKFTPSFHVYGITRRGSPPSSVPDSGYSASRLGDDVVAVIDALKLVRPVLVGHSRAGEELSSVGNHHPEKVSGLIYLDAGYSYALYDRENGDITFDQRDVEDQLKQLHPGKSQSDYGLVLDQLLLSLPRLQKDLETIRKTRQSVPEIMSRSEPKVSPVASAIRDGVEKYTEIHVPVLAIFADPHDLGSEFEDNPALRSEIEKLDRDQTEAQVKAFERQVPQARVVRLPNASHFVFDSNEIDVLREMNAFLGSLP